MLTKTVTFEEFQSDFFTAILSVYDANKIAQTSDHVQQQEGKKNN